MSYNPFYVQPGGDASAGLSGLSDTLEEIRKRKAIEAEKTAKLEELKAAKEEIGAAIQSGDPAVIRPLLGKYPQFAEVIDKGMGWVNDEQKARGKVRIQELALSPPKDRPAILERQINEGERAGRDMTESRKELEFFQRNPEMANKIIEAMHIADMTDNEYKSYIASKEADKVIYSDQEGNILGSAIPNSHEAKILEQQGGIPVKDPSLSDLRGPKAPSGYRYTSEGNLEAIPGGPGDTSASDLNQLPIVPLSENGKPDPIAQEEFMKSVDPVTGRLIKQITDYKMDISKVTSLRKGERQKVAKMATAYDPTFDMTQYAARAAMRKSVTSGTYSQALQQSNLVIQHLGALKKSIEGLDNVNFQAYNSVKNFLKDQFGDPAITKFNTTADAAATELAKVFKGTGVTSEREIQDWRKNLNINGSPEQIKQSIDTAIKELLKSRIDTIKDRYKSAMGKPLDMQFLTPHSKEILTDLGVDPSELEPVSNQLSENEGIPEFSSEAEVEKAGIKPGTKIKINGVMGTWQ